MESPRGGCCYPRLFMWIIHTALCVGIPGMLISRESELREWVVEKKEPAWGVAYLTLVLLALTSFYMASLMSPGYLRKNSDEDDGNKDNNGDADADADDDADDDDDDADDGSEEGSKMLPKSKDKVELFFCSHCKMEQPLRSRHCEDCDRCVRKFDHHCPWLQNCIGERNHKIFWFFLLFHSILIIWTFKISFYALTWAPHLGEWLAANWLTLVVLLGLALAALVVLGLLGVHTFLAMVGATTWEQFSREKITYLMNLEEGHNPFSQGPCCNTYQFCCTFSEQRWEDLYRSRPDAIS